MSRKRLAVAGRAEPRHATIAGAFAGTARFPGRRILRVTGQAFVLLGATILLFAVYELVGTSLVTKGHQASLRREFRESLAAQTAAPSPTPPSRLDSTTELPQTPVVSRGLTRLRIPRIGLDVITVEGVSRAALAKGPGRYPETARLGEPGTTGIAGHRTGWGAPFFDLDKLERGDSVTFTTTTGIYTYKVTRKIVVDPEDVWVLNGDPRSRAAFKLALTTCTPKFTSLRRLIVWADLVEFEPRA